MLLYIPVFTVAFLVTLALVPLVKLIAKRIGAVDKPDQRKVHEVPTPRLGGLAIFIGFVAAMCTAVGVAYFINRGMDGNLLFGMLFGATILVIVGIVDDVKNLSAPIKFLFQIIVASIAYYYGIQIDFISHPFGGDLIILGLWAIPFTILWIVGITNAINLIDGLDGLATGVTLIAAVTLFLVALRTHQIDAAVQMAALAGCALAFLRYNFNPASIFLGDAGSLFLGFVLASASVAGVLKSTIFVALVIPILILGIPIYDTASVIFRRVRSKQPVFTADKRHLHHRLLRAGFTQREAVLVIYGACMMLSVAALGFIWLNSSIAFIVLFAVLIVAWISLWQLKRWIRSNMEETA
ncbi:MAG: MraY family glycosyltransferase [bacterium]